MTVRELGARMDATELAEWAAVFALEVEEQQQADLRETVTHELTRARNW